MAHKICNENGKSSHHLKSKDRVTGTYTDIYLADDYCEYHKSVEELIDEDEEERISSLLLTKETWKSPSDYLIGLLASAPPFTSKVLRSNTHNGILAIGDNLLEIERDDFDEELTNLIKENEAAWEIILNYERESIQNKVKKISEQSFTEKTKIFLSEATKFYEQTLQEMEDKLRAQLQLVLVDVRANIVNDFNIKGREVLKSEKEQLDTVLKRKFSCDVEIVKQYYDLLLTQVLNRHKKLINQAQVERNDTLRAFLNQIEAEHITNTMYVLCKERKKCKINQFVMNNHLMTEISDKMNTLNNYKKILNDLPNTKVGTMKDWEEKVLKIAQLFLKFIGFSLKLLPEQTTFLLDLEKMVVLQLNEIQKSPLSAHSILIDKNNCFNFEKLEPSQNKCDKKPFEIIGDIDRDDIPTQHGSTETLPVDVNLPYIRVGRQYIYAKCENFEQVKDFLTPQKCKCRSYHEEKPLKGQVVIKRDSISISKPMLPRKSQSKESTTEQLLIEDIHPLKECPVQKCKSVPERNTLSPIESFLNFTEENLKKLRLLEETQESIYTGKLINPIDEVFKKMPFAETGERCCNAETQYSSQESFIEDSFKKCCCNNVGPTAYVNSSASSTIDHKKDGQKNIDNIMRERKLMFSNLIYNHPKLMNIFTDESFNLPF